MSIMDNYPPGAATDPTAPWNAPDMPEECRDCRAAFDGDDDMIEVAPVSGVWAEFICRACAIDDGLIDAPGA
jgi:hypothetical protein